MDIRIPVTWEVCATVHIEANSIDEALTKFDEIADHIRLPDGEYVDGSPRSGAVDGVAPAVDGQSFLYRYSVKIYAAATAMELPMLCSPGTPSVIAAKNSPLWYRSYCP